MLALVPLDVERIASPAVPRGGSGSPTDTTALIPRRRGAGDALDAEQTVACRCQCPPEIVSAGRRTYCDRCDAPIVHKLDGASAAAGALAVTICGRNGGRAPHALRVVVTTPGDPRRVGALCAPAAAKASSFNANGRGGWARPGHTQEVSAPMRDASYLDALAALDAEVRRGGRSVEVACRAEDCGHALLLVDDSQFVRDSFGHRNHEWRPFVVERLTTDPELDALDTCPGCGDEVNPEIVVLRDRHRRAQQEIAELRAVA